MALHRHDGLGWVAARATYTPYEMNVSGGGPPIWLRARTLWRVTDGGWQPTTPGYAAGGADVTLSAGTLARTHNGGFEILDPVTGDPNAYWESYADVTAGLTCYSYALWWRYDVSGEDGTWKFWHSANINPGQTVRVPMNHGSNGHLRVQWCATGFDGQIVDHLWIPPGQQGFSRLARG